MPQLRHDDSQLGLAPLRARALLDALTDAERAYGYEAQWAPKPRDYPTPREWLGALAEHSLARPKYLTTKRRMMNLERAVLQRMSETEL